ncbi:large ribosomal subunit protein eL27-like [Ochotona princeps]|uniref:large ribosomal subunit protein eL27-like n=1 Tax=Ochotona princeps TaxID=9978 RepID=UPI00271455AE|nr:large ribosomal subunit protein eL27-like [Ochotona princeps]
MVKLLKAGRVVVVLSGRHAGKKGVVVNTWEGSKERQFSYCLIAGIERGPLKVSKRMAWKKVEKRMRVKPFIKYINVNHLMPTRYTVANDIDVKTLASEENMRTAEEKKKARKALKQIFFEKFMNPMNEKVGKMSKDLLFLRRKLRF